MTKELIGGAWLVPLILQLICFQGALLYEMLCGRPPHYQPKNRKQMLRDIVEKPVEMKDYFSPEAKQILTQLLERNPAKRLGNTSSDASAQDILSHPFFRNINWPDLRAGKVKPPYKPVVAGPDDTRNIDTLFLNEKIKETPDQSMTGSEKTKTNFKGFTYNQDELLKKK